MLRSTVVSVALLVTLLAWLPSAVSLADSARISSAPTGAADLIALNDAQLAKLQAGELILIELEPTGGSGLAYRAMRVIDAPPDQVWPVVRDCEHFSAFMPRTKRSEKLHSADGATHCLIEIDMPFPVEDMRSEVSYEVQQLSDGGYRRSWSLVRGDYHHNQGSWTVRPWGPEAERSLLIYRMDMNPKSAIPDFVIRAAQALTLPEAYQAIAGRIRDLAPARVSSGPAEH